MKAIITLLAEVNVVTRENAIKSWHVDENHSLRSKKCKEH